MKKLWLIRAMALTLCLAVAGLPGIAEEALTDWVDAPVEENVEFELAAAPAEPVEAEIITEVMAEEGAAPEANPAEGQSAENAAGEASTAENAAPEQPEATPEALLFDKTFSVKTDAWEDVNLARAEGFTKVFAKVKQKLTLKGVLIEGVPARQADLLAAFNLKPTGEVAVEDGAALNVDVAAFCFNKGDTRKLKLSYNGEALKGKQAAWSSDNPKVAKVSASGKITAKKKGKATITASYAGETVRCQVQVTDLVYPKSVKLSATRLTVSVNNTAKLKAKVSPKNADYPEVTWTTSDKKVVTVDENGKLKGIKAGKATVTATTGNGKSASCSVTVEHVPTKAVDFKQLYITMNPGGSFSTEAQLTPADASQRKLSYKSSNKKVATVDSDGVITAVGCGAATITVKVKGNKSVKNTCKVCVIEPDAARMAGLVIGINPGHQITTDMTLYPLAPGSSEKGKGVKTGACGKWTRVNEYETNLQIGLKLAKLLTKAGATVVITRTSNDVMLTNIQRAQMLNKAKVDVALQLHCNSISNQSAEGCSGYIRTTGDWVAESRALSDALTKAISKKTGCVNLGVMVYNHYMSLNWTTTPSVLLEMGYISNYKEDKLLASDAYRTKMAKGIMQGLCDYFGR